MHMPTHTHMRVHSGRLFAHFLLILARVCRRALVARARSALSLLAMAGARASKPASKPASKSSVTKTIVKPAAKKPAAKKAATAKKPAAKKPAAAKNPAAAKKVAASPGLKKKAAAPSSASPGKKMLYAPESGSDVDIAARVKAAIAILNDKPGSALKTQAAVVVLEGVLKVML